MAKILKKLIKADMRDYSPIALWSWNNKIDREELIKQIHSMKFSGCGRFIIKPALGLRTEYLGVEWFDLIKTCLTEAKHLEMNVYLSDGLNFNVDFYGQLEESERAAYLDKKVKKTFDESAYAVFVKNEYGELVRVNAPTENAEEKYYTVYVKTLSQKLDLLSDKVTDKYICRLLGQYFKHFEKYFGREFVGFCSEGLADVGKFIPYTQEVEKYFADKFGESVKDGVASLFWGKEKSYCFRIRYLCAINALYNQNFYKKVYDWCNKHGCKFIGCGAKNYILSNEHLHVPAVRTSEFAGRDMCAKEVGSFASEFNKKHVLACSFEKLGYGVTPKDLKTIVEKQFVQGANLLCFDYPYTIANCGATGQNPCFSSQTPWKDEYLQFNNHFTKLGYLLSNSESVVNCVVIKPSTDLYAFCDGQNQAETLQKFYQLIGVLNKFGILFDITDEKVLTEYGKLIKSKLKIGRKEYTYVIVPECENMLSKTKYILNDYIKNGGKIIAAGIPKYTVGIKDDWSFLKTNASYGEIAKNGAIDFGSNGKVRYSYRKGKRFEFLFIVNNGSEGSEIVLPKSFSKLNVSTLKREKMPLSFVLDGGESIVLMPMVGKKRPHFSDEKSIIDNFRFTGMSKNALVLDKVCLSKNGKDYSKPTCVREAFDSLIQEKYNGEIYLKYKFTVKEKEINAFLWREKGKYTSSLVNGKQLCFKNTSFDPCFESADIRGLIKDGVNEYVVKMDFFERPEVYRALNTNAQCEGEKTPVLFDAELNNCYVLGDFSIDEKGGIIPFYPPEVACAYQDNGLKNFCGKITFTADIVAEKNFARIRVSGDYAVAEIKINDVKRGNCLFVDYVDVPLHKGEHNSIEITLVSTLVNSFDTCESIIEKSNLIDNETIGENNPSEKTQEKRSADDREKRSFGLKDVTLSYIK